MPNSIKYSTSSESNSLTSGNFHLGVGDVDKGPTLTTGYYNGINPPSGGYTIYLNKASDGPSIYTPANDTELISLTNSIGAQSFTTAAQCKEWFVGQNDKMLVNREYENIVTDGLVFMVDAGFTPSYPGIGTTWTDLAGSNNGTLTNGPTFDSGNGGSIVFDETNDIVEFTSIDVEENFTCCVWAKTDDTNRQTLMANSYTYHVNNNTEGFLFNIGNSGTDLFLSLGRDLYYRISSTNIVTADTWFYACASYDGTTIKLYYNGAETSYSGQGGSPTTITYETNPLYLGGWKFGGNNYYSNDFYGGNITQATLYNRALSSTEITQNYNAQKGRFGIT